MFRRLVGRIVRAWPLMRKATHLRRLDYLDRLCERSQADALNAWTEALRMQRRAEVAEKERDAARAEVEAERGKTVGIQSAFASIMRDWPTWREWERCAITQGRPPFRAFLAEPCVSIVLGQASSFRTADVPVVTFGARVAIGLTEDCPPELVADRIANEVRAAILAKWRDQSFLLKSPGAQ